MDTLPYVDTVMYVLLAVCGALTALAVVFLVARPWLDPHWRDGEEEARDTDALNTSGSSKTIGPHNPIGA